MPQMVHDLRLDLNMLIHIKCVNFVKSTCYVIEKIPMSIPMKTFYANVTVVNVYGIANAVV